MSFPTSWNDFTTPTEYGPRPRPLEQRGGDVYFIVHHAVNRRVQDTIALSKPGGRRVSMTFAIGPTQAGVESPVYCVGVVPESMRPFTTASPLDQAAFTVEVSNLDLTADYPVAVAAKEWLAQIAAYMHRTFQMPLDRTHVLSHQEVHKRGFGSYPTACPGPDLQRSLDDIIDRAKFLATPIETETDETMSASYLFARAESGKPARYAIVGLDVPGGSTVTTVVAEAEAMGFVYGQQSGPRVGAPIREITQAQLDAAVALYARLRAQKVAEEKSSGGSGASAQDVAKAVDAELKDDFAAVNANVNKPRTLQ